MIKLRGSIVVLWFWSRNCSSEAVVETSKLFILRPQLQLQTTI